MTTKRTKLRPDEWKPETQCAYLAPYICFQNPDTRTWHVNQSCCNHWDCPRCGILRAKEEYARIVEGVRTLTTNGHRLFFWTLTCRGKELTAAEAEAGYLLWTNRILDNARYKARRVNHYWSYVQVTERQKRGHPHSHLITTFCPDDAVYYKKGELLPNNRYARHDGLWSAWLRHAVRIAGLGQEVDLSEARTPEALSRYAAKYLFKQTALDRWPPGWKRVRYSQNWPRVPERDNATAFPVITFRDWFRVHDIGEPVRADSVYTYAAAQARGIDNVLSPAW